MSTLRTLRFSLPLVLMVAAAAVSAAEQQQGTLSKDATAAGPAVDTSKTTNVSAAEAPPAAEPSTASERAGGPRAVVRNDRLDLDTTTVTGNRELPKVMYVVPWKKSDLGDLPAQPFNTLLDEALAPVDRDVFRREVTYYGAIHSEGGGGADAVAPQPPRSEK